MEVFEVNKKEVVVFLVGLLCLGIALVLFKSSFWQTTKIEIIDEVESTNQQNAIFVEIAGAVETPGVYRMNNNDRVESLLIASGGFSANADRDWAVKNLNRASILRDGQKIYIPVKGESASVAFSGGLGGLIDTNTLVNMNALVNINTAAQSELESLTGIGQVRAQAVIENRPYSSIDELLAKKVIPNSVYQKIKEKITAP